MGLFDFLKKPKTDLEQYYEDRKKREARNAAYDDRFTYQSDLNFYSAPTEFRLVVQDVFSITGRGTVVVGQVESGSVRVGEIVTLKRVSGHVSEVAVVGIEQFRKLMDIAKAGEHVGILLRGLTKADIGKGDVLLK